MDLRTNEKHKLNQSLQIEVIRVGHVQFYSYDNFVTL